MLGCGHGEEEACSKVQAKRPMLSLSCMQADVATWYQTQEVEISADRRSAAWQALLLGGLESEATDGQNVYKSCGQVPCSYDEMITRDVGRTLPQEELFRESHGKGQTALFRVLHALAVQHSDIGYVQSLNFMVATLINVFPDDEVLVFSCARSMLFRHSLADFYRPSFPKLGVALWTFDRLVEGFLPKAYVTLEAHGISAEFYAMQWFLTLFASDLPQNVVVQIWDRFFVVGWQAIVQVGLALLAEIQDELSELDSCAAMMLLKKFTLTRRFEAKALLNAASKFDVSHRMLSDLEAAQCRGEDPECTRIVAEENSDTVARHWYVQRGASPKPSPKLYRSNSNRSVGSTCSTAVPLPRAFEDGYLSDGEYIQCSPRPGGTDAAVWRRSSSLRPSRSSSPASGPSTPPFGNGTLLPFIIHNLDTGETTLLEEEWKKYLRVTEEKQAGRQTCLLEGPSSFLSKLSLQSALKEPCHMDVTQERHSAIANVGGACSGSFWIQEQQWRALRTLGKAC